MVVLYLHEFHCSHARIELIVNFYNFVLHFHLVYNFVSLIIVCVVCNISVCLCLFNFSIQIALAYSAPMIPIM